MGSNTESLVAPMIARLKAARIPLAGSPAHLRLNFEVARSDAPSLATDSRLTSEVQAAALALTPTTV